MFGTLRNLCIYSRAIFTTLAYSATLKTTKPHSNIQAHVKLGRKKFPDFGKKGPDCVSYEMFIEVP